MTYRIVITARARADVLESFRWLVERSPDAATRWYAGLQKAIAGLRKLPGRHPIAEAESELLGITMRQALHGLPNIYRILYSVEGDTIVVHLVRHSARGPIEP